MRNDENLFEFEIMVIVKINWNLSFTYLDATYLFFLSSTPNGVDYEVGSELALRTEGFVLGRALRRVRIGNGVCGDPTSSRILRGCRLSIYKAALCLNELPSFHSVGSFIGVWARSKNSGSKTKCEVSRENLVSADRNQGLIFTRTTRNIDKEHVSRTAMFK
jgi:hypothetical protein